MKDLQQNLYTTQEEEEYLKISGMKAKATKAKVMVNKMAMKYYIQEA
jgi:hypothetical protein